MTAQSHPSLAWSDIRIRKPAAFGSTFSEKAMQLTYNGRGALFQLLSAMGGEDRRTVLLPAFHCPTVVDPVIRAGYEPRYYAIREDLSVDVDDLLAKLTTDTAAVITINYFGFPTDTAAIHAACNEMGARLIEDCAHSFLLTDPVQLTGTSGTAAIYSFKKLVPSMIGGAYSIDSSPVKRIPPPQSPPLRDSFVTCMRLLEQLVSNLEDSSRIKHLLQSAENYRVRWKTRGSTGASEERDRDLQFEYPFDERLAVSTMPWYARRILFAADLSAIAAARRRNFQYLLQHLGNQEALVPVFRTLPPRICPWTFPVYVENRSDVDILLRKAGVPVFTFGETLHASLQAQVPADGFMLRKARWLSSTLLCIPIHQQCTISTLERYCSCVEDVCHRRHVSESAFSTSQK